ncbi:MAG: hypothetical protein K5634_05395, partial [Sphaerochaetaceae bacterium]|nr:hypothetical protein [Sphaerochaetaceae bacterium]
MKKITAVSLILLCSITLIFAQAMGENLSSIAEGMTVETKEETHTFTVDVLTAAADKEAVAEGSSVDMEGHGYFKVSGSVLKRWKEDKGVTSVEVGKALSGSIDFTVTGTADVVLTVSSNGGSNSSAVGIIDQNGNLIENAEKITVVEGTSKTVLTYNGLQAGTYKVVSPAHSEFKRGARVYTVVANETVTVEPAPEADSYEWDFTYFGVSVGKDRNFLVSSGEGIKDPVSLSSATFNEDGSIKKKGGKFVSDAPADGASYYYTVIDPTTTNFYLQADVTVDQINPTLDGQEGFALMARDAIGDFGAGGSWMANLVSVTCAKLPSPNTSATIGVRAYTGIYTSEASDQNQVASTLLGWYKNEEGNPIKVEVGKTYRVSLEKTDYAYIATQYDIDTNKVIGSYTYYIPAKDNEAVSVKSYSELNDPLTFQEANAAYIALVVARGLNATFSNIKFTTSSWKAENWKPQPTTYVDLTASVISSETTAGGEYNLVFRTNADGLADVYCADRLVAENVPVEAGVQCRVSFEMPEEKADVNVKFTPDPEFKFSAYEKLSSYDTVTFGMTVTQRSLGKDSLIYVAVNGQEKNNGTSFEDATDLLTAFKYVAPGQGIILEAGVYDLSGVGITVSRGRDGSFENPIVVTTKDDGFATFDFGGTGSGMKLWGDWWYLSNINITRTADGKHGMQLAGSNCYLYRVNFYNNGTSGLTVSGDSKDTIEFWPAYNTIDSCTSMNNADKALEDADGFCAKLTTGEGNVFDKCISAYNADDGWDLFAKVASGSIGQVTIKNSLTYKNGYLMVKEGGTSKNFEFADVYCDNNGTLTFGKAVEMEAGNGNGFKMGGSNLAGGHTLINSIAYENKTKGIDSNSCPDIKAFNCTSYNNGSYNIAMYTGNKSATTDFSANGVISFRSGDYKNQPETLSLQGQNNSAVYGISNYWWDIEKKVSENTEGTAVDESWFVSLDTSVAPERNADGTINMHGLLLL